MRLDQYRLSKGLSYSALARLTKASHATVVRRWCLPTGHKDKKIPAPKFMMRIQEITGGSVQPNDFYRNAGND